MEERVKEMIRFFLILQSVWVGQTIVITYWPLGTYWVLEMISDSSLGTMTNHAHGQSANTVIQASCTGGEVTEPCL